MAKEMQTIPDMLICVDLETDGLKSVGGHVLEVAAYVTDTDLNILDEGFHAVIRYSEEQAREIRERSHPIVQEMHDKTGLWSRLPQGVPLSEAAGDFLSYIKKHAPHHRQARIMGSSVRFDHNWIEEHFPEVYDHLHYREVDVSGIQALFDWWGLEYERAYSDGDTPHEATKDIQASIFMLQSIRRAMLGGDRP